MATETNFEEPGSYTQVKAQQDIVAWSADRPDWQRDALRQLINGVDVDEIDLDRLEALCVGERKDFQFLEEIDPFSQGRPDKRSLSPNFDLFEV